MDVRAEEAQRAAAIAALIAAGIDPFTGEAAVAGPPVPPPAPPRQRWVRTVTRPRRWPRGVHRFDALPRELAVPLVLQTMLDPADRVYEEIAQSAYLLTHGQFDSLVVGNSATSNIGYGLPLARWVLTLTFRHAPDDEARSGILTVLDTLPTLADLLIFDSVGPNAVIDCLAQSGAAQSYRPLLPQYPVTLGLLQAGAVESRHRDSDRLALFGIADTALPAPGWGSRCANALWAGLFPSELLAGVGTDPGRFGVPSFVVLRSAAARAVNNGQRQGLIRAVATHPSFDTPDFAGISACLVGAMAYTHPDEYRLVLAADPGIRDRLASAMRRSSAGSDADTDFVLGQRDSR